MTKYKGIKINGKKRDYHRWLMEQKLGRTLDKDEIIHHLDLNTMNNDINNLELMSRSEHSKLHSSTNYHFSEKDRELARQKNLGSIRINRKLNKEEIMFIKEHYIQRDKEFGSRGLGRRFGVDHMTILRIISGERYMNF